MVTSLYNQKRMQQGNTKRNLDLWGVKCNKHLNKISRLLKKDAMFI